MKHFEKSLIIKFHLKSRQVGAKLLHAGGRTDRLDEANTVGP
jgi:hypothetical protein